MSLLLNALKKVEEGDGKPEQESGVASPSTESTESTETTGAIAAEAVAEGADVVDIDSIPEEPPAESGEKKPQRQGVDAIRVFGAGEDGGGGLWKWIAGVVGIVAVGGGGYVLLISGIVPGLNMSIFGGLGGEQVVAAAPQDSGSLFDEEFADESLTLLPIPVIDVQSEVDFADLRLPENRPEIIGDEEYKKKIAIYTGYDIERERQRIIDDYQAEVVPVLEEEEIFDLDGDLVVSEDALAEEEELVVRTAYVSRREKARVDALTSSEFNLNIVVNNNDGSKGAEVAEVVVAEAAVEGVEAVEADTVAAVVVAEVQIGLSDDGVKRNILLKQAQRLYYNGMYLEAESIYRNILREAATNIDALRGLALVAVATGRYQLAASTYLNILDYYPNDPIAIAELTNLRVGGGKGDFYETERILKRLLGKSPAADGRIYFALGNLYASHAKWYKAQEAYFEAYSRDLGNPDYGYNLAVVFDYLNKPKLAVRYYERALELSDNVLVGFDRNEVKKRIAEIN